MKKKFNKEERKAIIAKLSKIADERVKESRKHFRDFYVPSEKYKKLQNLLEQLNQINKELSELYPRHFYGWRYDSVNIQNYLDVIRDEEIDPLVTKYYVNKEDLEVEIILADQDDSIDELIENLLSKCLQK